MIASLLKPDTVQDRLTTPSVCRSDLEVLNYLDSMNLGPLEILIILVLLVLIAGLLVRSVVRRR
jgi:hypothetical protein